MLKQGFGDYYYYYKQLHIYYFPQILQNLAIEKYIWYQNYKENTVPKKSITKK